MVEAMDATGIRHLSGRLVDERSGGQRQPVWMAVALAPVITESLVADVFGLDARVILDPESGSPLVVPSWRH